MSRHTAVTCFVLIFAASIELFVGLYFALTGEHLKAAIYTGFSLLFFGSSLLFIAIEIGNRLAEIRNELIRQANTRERY